jgi:DNA repair exonuclease SbcCD ATPase subunit
MIVVKATVSNFGSYDYLEFHFNARGLALLAGATGAGKSTLCDIVPWVLFGITAKNGAVDDVRSWHGGVTTGILEVEIGQRQIEIVRVRGTAKDNDLTISVNHEEPRRGKDLADTQRLIIQELGITPELYLAGAYFHEFSQTASFFVAPAKVRRLITEQLVDLEMAVKLTENIAAAKKAVKARTIETDTMLVAARAKAQSAGRSLISAKGAAVAWTNEQATKIEKVKGQLWAFDTNKQARIAQLEESMLEHEEQVAANVAHHQHELQELKEVALAGKAYRQQLEALRTDKAKLSDDVCNECGAKKDSGKHLQMIHMENGLVTKVREADNAITAMSAIQRLLKIEQAKENPYVKQLQAEMERENTYDQVLKALESEKNPHLAAIDRYEIEHNAEQNDVMELQELRDDLRLEASDLDTLSDVVNSFRGAIVKRAIKDLEVKTNDLLDRHFEAELRVTFDIASADKLEVEILKDGNVCSYSQLSKGQRQLLKLCFGVSVMKVVAEHHAVEFDAIFLDEFADGCDENIKAKAFGLLEELSQQYSSVFAIDHSEGLKSMFTTRYDIKLVDGRSVVEKAS